MTRPLPERLYELLPTIVRQRDVAEGEPLRALMAVLEQEYERVRANVETSWDNWFIETCESWLIPYIGQSIGVDPTHLEAAELTPRAFVANTLAYRRRRGTALVLEQLAQDITGYRVRAVEYFQRLRTTAHMHHLRELQARPGADSGGEPALGGTVDLREPRRLEHCGGPFDPQAHGADIRDIARARGRHNIPNLGLHLWRVGSVEITRVQARPWPGEPNWFLVDPWGLELPLYNVPKTESDISTLAERVHVPAPLTRLELAHDQQLADPMHLGDDPAIVLRLAVDGVPHGPLGLQVCDLSDGLGGLPSRRPDPGIAAIDPQLGRVVLNDDDLPSTGELELLVDYAYGAPAKIGAGAHDRRDAFADQLGDLPVTWRAYVSRNPELAKATELGALPTLEAAIAAWNSQVAGGGAGVVGLIVVLGGRTHDDRAEIPPESRLWPAPTSTIQLPDGARLTLVAAGVDIDSSTSSFDPVARGTRAIIQGDLVVTGTGGDESQTHAGGLFLNGLGIQGSLRVEAGELETLGLSHCSLDPQAGSLSVSSSAGSTNAGLCVRVDRCFLSAVSASASAVDTIEISDSVVLGAGAPAISAVAAGVEVDSSTLVGPVNCRTLSASDSIFDGPITTEQHQEGCLRTSYIQLGGQAPRPYRCQPQLALEGVDDTSQREQIIARLRPSYVSLRFGDPACGLLRPDAPRELREGAEDGSEMGAFHHLQFARREANLRNALRRYLRFGLEAGLFIES